MRDFCISDKLLLEISSTQFFFVFLFFCLLIVCNIFGTNEKIIQNKILNYNVWRDECIFVSMLFRSKFMQNNINISMQTQSIFIKKKKD